MSIKKKLKKLFENKIEEAKSETIVDLDSKKSSMEVYADGNFSGFLYPVKCPMYAIDNKLQDALKKNNIFNDGVCFHSTDKCDFFDGLLDDSIYCIVEYEASRIQDEWDEEEQMKQDMAKEEEYVKQNPVGSIVDVALWGIKGKIIEYKKDKWGNYDAVLQFGDETRELAVDTLMR